MSNLRSVQDIPDYSLFSNLKTYDNLLLQFYSKFKKQATKFVERFVYIFYFPTYGFNILFMMCLHYI